jgi:hypothetical protein
MKRTVLTVLMTNMLLLIIILAADCTKNFYDEELRDEVIVNRVELLDEGLVLTKKTNGEWKFSKNYLAGFYRIALLGEGENDEDNIARMIDDYKLLIDKIRGKNPQTKGDK